MSPGRIGLSLGTLGTGPCVHNMLSRGHGLEASGATGRGPGPELDQGWFQGQVTGQVLCTHEGGRGGQSC